MFFLKELPTQAMVERYSEEHFPGNANEVMNTLVQLRRYSALIRKLNEYFASQKFVSVTFFDNDGY